MHVLSAWRNRRSERDGERSCSDSEAEEVAQARVRESMLAEFSAEVVDIAVFHIEIRTSDVAKRYFGHTVCYPFLIHTGRTPHLNGKSYEDSEKVLGQQV